MKIEIKKLEEKIINLLISKNFSKEDSENISDYLIWAEKTGNKTQGIIKLTGTEPLQNIKPKSEMKVERDTKISQLIDGGANAAPLTASKATDVVIRKAKDIGFGIVGVRNTFSSNGAQAYYVEKIAKENLIGIMCSRSPAATSGFGSISPLFGTNPIGFSFPTKNNPMVFDMATSVMTFYGLILANAKGEKIPENMAVDKNGELTLNPKKAMEGALLPFDRSYKGAGLAMMVEILTGPLINSAWIDNKTFKEEWGSLFIAIDPEILIDIDKFKNNIDDLILKIKSSRVKDGKKIRLPGERALKLKQESEKRGYVNVEEAILKELKFI